MDSKPTLQEFLASHPHKNANDYYALYGQKNMAEDDIFEFLTPTPPPPSTPSESYTFQEPFSSKKKKAKVDIINIIAAIITIITFFLPWVQLSEFKESITASTTSGWNLQAVYQAFKLPDFSPIASYSVYLILIGSIIALIAEGFKHWELRIIGQIFTLCFGILWIYILQGMFFNPEIAPKDLSLTTYFQYGFYPLLLGLLLYLISVISTCIKTPEN